MYLFGDASVIVYPGCLRDKEEADLVVDETNQVGGVFHWIEVIQSPRRELFIGLVVPGLHIDEYEQRMSQLECPVGFSPA